MRHTSRVIPAAVIPFDPAASGQRFTRADRAAVIALGYALAGWEVAFEGDGQGMHWAALCPPGRNCGSAAARYLIGRDGGALVLLSAASGEVLGCYGTGTALAQDVRRWEGSDRDPARPAPPATRASDLAAPSVSEAIFKAAGPAARRGRHSAASDALRITAAKMLAVAPAAEPPRGEPDGAAIGKGEDGAAKGRAKATAWPVRRA